MKDKLNMKTVEAIALYGGASIVGLVVAHIYCKRKKMDTAKTVLRNIYRMGWLIVDKHGKDMAYLFPNTLKEFQ